MKSLKFFFIRYPLFDSISIIWFNIHYFISIILFDIHYFIRYPLFHIHYFIRYPLFHSTSIIWFDIHYFIRYPLFHIHYFILYPLFHLISIISFDIHYFIRYPLFHIHYFIRYPLFHSISIIWRSEDLKIFPLKIFWYKKSQKKSSDIFWFWSRQSYFQSTSITRKNCRNPNKEIATVEMTPVRWEVQTNFLNLLLDCSITFYIYIYI